MFYSEFFLSKQQISKTFHYQYYINVFRALKIAIFYLARCVFVYTNFCKFTYKDFLAFLQKGKKTAELVFLFYLKSGLKFQNNLSNSFLISKDFRIIHIRII